MDDEKFRFTTDIETQTGNVKSTSNAKIYFEREKTVLGKVTAGQERAIFNSITLTLTACNLIHGF